jgi:nucleotide-binding universal stress UspA family protein
MGKEEKTRVDREAIDRRGFVTNLERLLLAVDDSINGKFAARLAGLIAGAQGMPITVVRVNEIDGTAAEPADGPSRQIKEGAKASAAVIKQDRAEPDPEKVHITTRVEKVDDGKAVAEEACKGFDIMTIGLAETHDKEGRFTPQVTKLARDFDGTLALLAANDPDHLPPVSRRMRILVPINGTPAARNAAEIAFAIARPLGARVTALYVSQGADARGATRTQEEALLKDIVELGERYDVGLRTALQSRGNAEVAILRHGANHNLIVMGVSQRPGDQLFFGNTANAVLKKYDGAILFVAS